MKLPTAALPTSGERVEVGSLPLSLLPQAPLFSIKVTKQKQEMDPLGPTSCKKAYPMTSYGGITRIR